MTVFQLLFFLFVNTTSFSKAEYFKVISGDDLAGISKLEAKLEKLSVINDKTAYLGALKMKKAEFQKTSKDKLALFKEGKDMLERTISKNSSNTEYRFLRLIIQENAPKVLKYNDKIQEDVKFISSHYLELNSEVKTAVLNYSKKSASLKL